MSRARFERHPLAPWCSLESCAAGTICAGCRDDGGPLGVRSVPIFGQRAPYKPAELFAVSVCVCCYRSVRRMNRAMRASSPTRIEAQP